jgi:hypothetical protein
MSEQADRIGAEMNDVQLKQVTITLDENQICVLHTMMNQLFADHPAESSRDDRKQIRQIINEATREVCA